MQSPGETALDVVLSATRALVGIAARSLAEVADEVSLAQFRVLVLLDTRPAQTMGEIAASLDVNPSTVTRVCDVLVEKKLIRRIQTKDNRRTVQAGLTPAGRRLLEQVMDRRRLLIEGALRQMSDDGQRRLALGLVEFAHAAGEVSDDAWLLGWTHDEDASDEDS
jgi:DNA-binding MarR family transcriptional regulator